MSNLMMVKKDTVDVVAEKVREFQETGELKLPANYSPENAMKSAWLTLQSTLDKNKQPVLQVCNKDSIANALLDMVVQGLTPAKNQCYFVAYGKSLVLMRSYFGSIAVTKRVANAKDIYAQVIFKGDDFQYDIDNGRYKIVKHSQDFTSRMEGNAIGAYAVIEFNDERPDYVELMTMEQIKQAWAQGKTYKPSGNGTHQKFQEEMVKKTVINRACKKYINSSNDDSLFSESFNRANDTIAEQEVTEEIEENANSQVIDIEVEQEETQPVVEPEPEEEQKEIQGPDF
ncbi:recombination protein RecT [Orenia metallireducens]|uniref:Recombination protein RecT n=1 Tax=Orenia metallireducens TaxID=1413210 RepID=A0A285G6Q1_9FIRM|nr:RecT family recombinase [Orenia metallireducens]SNY19270.1 recombination protein RecT [Orenia metallireducens]